MAFPVLRLHCKSQTSKVPLLMEHTNSRNENEHIIDIASTGNASSSSSSHERPSHGLEPQHSDEQPSISSSGAVYQPSPFSTDSNSRNTSLIRRGNSRGRQRSPLNSVLWISVELVLTVSQIIAAIVVLCLSKNEKPGAPLKPWIMGYASGCAAILPLLYWRFIYRNAGFENSSPLQQDSAQGNNNAGPLSGRVVDGENRQIIGTETRAIQRNRLPNPRYSYVYLFSYMNEVIYFSC